MKLKFKRIRLDAGRPIAFLNSEFAKKNNILQGSRIEVLFKNKKLILAVNLIERILNTGEISFSDEGVNFLRTSDGDEVEIVFAFEPKSVKYILKKMNDKELNKNEIHEIIKDVVGNALNEAEIAYFVSGVYYNGMSEKEIVYLTEAMAKTGKIIKWREKNIADKHSIGGIPGNRTTPIVVSICAAAGVKIPKTSSRAITSAAGTADVIETVTNVLLSVDELKKVVEKTNGCMVWGGSLGLAPADDKLIRVERLVNVDPEPQLIASIMSKKISAGSKHVLVDIPFGDGAKVSFVKAKNLKRKFERIGKHFNLNMEIVLTNGEQPIGNGIGPVLEMIDVLKVLKRDHPPIDLEKKSVFLSSRILEMTGEAGKGTGEKLAWEILNSGEAYKKFEEIIKTQGIKKIPLEVGKYKYDLRAKRSGFVKKIDNKLINLLAKRVGCPALKGGGIYLYRHKGEGIAKGEKILTVYSETENKLREGVTFLKDSSPVRIK